MILQRHQLGQPFFFWLIQELFFEGENVQEESAPIGNGEFYSWTIILAAALLLYAVAFRLIGG